MSQDLSIFEIVAFAAEGMRPVFAYNRDIRDVRKGMISKKQFPTIAQWHIITASGIRFLLSFYSNHRGLLIHCSFIQSNIKSNKLGRNVAL